VIKDIFHCRIYLKLPILGSLLENGVSSLGQDLWHVSTFDLMPGLAEPGMSGPLAVNEAKLIDRINARDQNFDLSLGQSLVF